MRLLFRCCRWEFAWSRYAMTWGFSAALNDIPSRRRAGEEVNWQCDDHYHVLISGVCLGPTEPHEQLQSTDNEKSAMVVVHLRLSTKEKNIANRTSLTKTTTCTHSTATPDFLVFHCECVRPLGLFISASSSAPRPRSSKPQSAYPAPATDP